VNYGDIDNKFSRFNGGPGLPGRIGHSHRPGHKWWILNLKGKHIKFKTYKVSLKKKKKKKK